MKNSTVLIAVGNDADLDALGGKLEALRSVPARAAVALVDEIPHFPYYSLGVPPYGGGEDPAVWQAAVSEKKAELKSRETELEALLRRHDAQGEVAVIAQEMARVSEAVARRAMLCDLAMVGDELRKAEMLFRQIVFGILFQSPIPLVLNDRGAKAVTGPKRIFVAWNTHLHTARAIHQALPILRQAEEVIIGSIDPVMSEYREGEDPGVDAAKWLTHHGCKVTVQQYPSGGREIGSCILHRSSEAGADLIVMGSYGRSRAFEAVFGGTTRTLIEQTEQAVFLAH